MWIRSQDKESLGEISRFEIISKAITIDEELPEEIKQEIRDRNNIEGDSNYIRSEYMVIGGSPNQEYGHLLGTYSTLEKALKVLDDIQRAIRLLKQKELAVQIHPRTIVQINADKYVIEMPQDSEVQV